MWCAVAAVLSIPTWLLWNWLVPDLFGFPTIGIAQAFGLLLLASCLFGARPEIKFGGSD